MFDPALLEAMPFTGQFATVASRDLYGGETYGTGIPFPCYWVQENRNTESAEGQETADTGKLWLPPGAYWTPASSVVPSTDLSVVLPDGSRRVVVMVETFRDADGIYGYEVTYG